MKYLKRSIILCAIALASPLATADPATRPSGSDDDGRRLFKGALGGLSEKVEQADRREDPMRYIAGDMGGIVSKLSEYQTDRPVQRKQEQVVQSLDLLIKELEKQCKGGGKAGSGGGKPLGQSTIVGGKGGEGEMIDPKKGDKQWAALPPKQREQILQSQTEGFPPGYENILQSYYRRLSQEQVTPTDASSSPVTTPASTTRPTNR